MHAVTRQHVKLRDLQSLVTYKLWPLEIKSNLICLDRRTPPTDRKSSAQPSDLLETQRHFKFLRIILNHNSALYEFMKGH